MVDDIVGCADSNHLYSTLSKTRTTIYPCRVQEIRRSTRKTFHSSHVMSSKEMYL